MQTLSSLPASTRASDIRDRIDSGPATPAPNLPFRLTEGLELIGQYEGSGLKNPAYLARRADGQVIQLSALLFAIAEATDGGRSSEEIATIVSQKLGRELDADDVRYLVDNQLRPTGIVQTPGSESAGRRTVPLLGLRFRTRVIPERVVRAVTTLFYPFFFTPIVIAALVAFAAFDVWLFWIHGTAQPIRHAIYEPSFFLLVFAMTATSALFHECGHATACRFSGGRPGAMGVGIYLVWPAFFTDVTDAYRLSRGGRVRTDLGGVYFNVIFSLGTAAAYFATGYEALLVVVILQHVQMLYQFLPFLRLDGYYLVADITGVPDLFARLGPTLRTLVPWKKDRRAQDLKPWVRAVVTLWVVSTVGFLLYMLGSFVLALPRMLATLGDSFALRYGEFESAWAAGDTVQATASALQLGALVLPAVGALLILARILKKFTGAVHGWSSASWPRAAFATTLAATAGVILATWWPTFETGPITAAERWTLDEPAKALTESVGGDSFVLGSASPISFDEEAEAETLTASSQPAVGSSSSDGDLVPPPPTLHRTSSEASDEGVEEGPSPVPSPSDEPSESPTPSPTPSESGSPSPSSSPSPSPSPSSSESPSPSSSPSPSPSESEGD